MELNNQFDDQNQIIIKQDEDIDNQEDMENQDDFYEPKTKIKKDDRFAGIFTMQAIICVLIVIGIVVTKTFFAPLYEKGVEKYKAYVFDDTGFTQKIEQYKQKILSIFEGLKPLQGQQEESSSQSSEPDDPPTENPQDTPPEVEQDANHKPSPEQTSFTPVTFTGEHVSPLEGRITSVFGYRDNPVTNKTDFHKGVDIAAKEGEPIKAFSDGVVEQVAVSEYLGNYVKLGHASDFVTVYGHCSEILVQQGQKVETGKTVALVGSTGYATGSHLHFEVLKDGVWVNPLWVL